MTVSAVFRRLSRPSSAFWVFPGPSQRKGVRTTATVSAPSSRAQLAITGAAPVPVPPPMPAVMKTMSAPWRFARISSRLSSAATAPRSAFPPAPRPRMLMGPRGIFTWDWLWERLCWSVFMAMSCTPVTPLCTIRSSALHPAPPTPTTLMLAPGRCTGLGRNGISGMGSPSSRSMFIAIS